MKVILKQDVEKVGRKGDIINVSAGYGRNYLLAQEAGHRSDPLEPEDDRDRTAGPEKEGREERLSFQDLIQKLNEVTLSFARKAGEKDMIFGSVCAADIKDALVKLGFDIDKKKIVLDEPIKRLGNFTDPGQGLS